MKISHYILAVFSVFAIAAQTDKPVFGFFHSEWDHADGGCMNDIPPEDYLRLKKDFSFITTYDKRGKVLEDSGRFTRNGQIITLIIKKFDPLLKGDRKSDLILRSVDSLKLQIMSPIRL